MFTRILVPYDGSKSAERALLKAIDLARLCQCDLTVLTVYRHHAMLEASLSMVRPMNAPSNLDDVLRREAREVAEWAKRQAIDGGVPNARAFVKAGYTARTITGFAEKNGYDLIVMGTRGLGSIEDYLLGSVSHKVSGTSPCPVMLV